MLLLKRIGCRAFQTAFRAASPALPYREPQVLRSCAELGDVFQKENISAALVVTDKGIVENGLLAPVENVLKDRGVSYVVYDRTQPNPTTENVEEALQYYVDGACEALIAIGGGSAIDCAKAVGARVAYPDKKITQLGGVMRILRPLPTLIAIPTTAGTGSEVTPVAVITDAAAHHKYALMSFPLIPHYAVLDATLTYSLPPHLTATTGIDALTDAVEAYIGRTNNAETRTLAREATGLVFRYVKKAYHNGQDHYAREGMLRAAYKAGIAFSRSYVGYIHAIAHSLGGRYGIPHGLANAVIMPYVLEAYGPCIHERLHHLAVVAGLCADHDSHEYGARRFIEAVRILNAEMGIPHKLKGIKKEDIAEMARYAEKEANPLYPVPRLMTRKELERFYYQIADWSAKT